MTIYANIFNVSLTIMWTSIGDVLWIPRKGVQMYVTLMGWGAGDIHNHPGQKTGEAKEAEKLAMFHKWVRLSDLPVLPWL